MMELLINDLLESNIEFKEFWSSRSDIWKKNFIAKNKSIDDISQDKTEIIKLHNSSCKFLQMLFLVIPEQNLMYTRIPKSWNPDKLRKKDIDKYFNHAKDIINSFIEENNIDCIFYGNIKSPKSTKEKITAIKKYDIYAGELLRDIVRFRLIVKDITDLKNIGILFWEYFFNNIIRCRNYYFNFKNDSIDNPYKALHFELLFCNEFIVEIQLVTENREISNWLDYYTRYKPWKELIPKHNEYVHLHLMKANIYDVNLYRNNSNDYLKFINNINRTL